MVNLRQQDQHFSLRVRACCFSEMRDQDRDSFHLSIGSTFLSFAGNINEVK